MQEILQPGCACPDQLGSLQRFPSRWLDLKQLGKKGQNRKKNREKGRKVEKKWGGTGREGRITKEECMKWK